MSRFVSLALLGTALVATSAWGAATEPRTFIRETADEVIAVLENEGLSSDGKVAAIEELADRRFDFRVIAKLVLARNWRKLDDTQRADFEREFKKHLSVTYGDNVDQYDDQRVEITGDREEPRGDWTVQSRILGESAADEIFVDYRLRKRDGEWRIIDVVVERVSLVSNFRSQLKEMISDRGVEKTLEVLRKKNASGESLIPDDQRKPPKRG